LKNGTSAAHHPHIFNRRLTLSLFVALVGVVRGATGDLKELRAQLERADQAQDKPAVVEISRRILSIAPRDEDAWERLVATELKLGDLDRCEESLVQWTKANPKAPAGIDDYWGDLLVRRKDYPNAERHWLAFLARKPAPGDAAAMYDKLADMCQTQQRWQDFATYSAKAVSAEDSAGRRLIHAIALLHLRQWDLAFAELAKAQLQDSTNPQLKQFLPSFERLSLPRIKALDTQIRQTSDNAGLMLDRARLFTLAEMPGLALDDAKRAMSRQPNWMRARIQTGEALLDDKRIDAAAAIEVSRNLMRGKDGHVPDQALRELSEADIALTSDPANAEALSNRSRTLRGLNQFVLALADAKAAIATNDNSATAHAEAAFSLKELNQTGEALQQAVRATDLNPRDPTTWFCRGIMEAARADLAAAITSQTRALKLRESLRALRERERCARQSGQIDLANSDLQRIQQLERPPR
jgi:tetratricopeptide (TPR) repeat protein